MTETREKSKEPMVPTDNSQLARQIIAIGQLLAEAAGQNPSSDSGTSNDTSKDLQKVQNEPSSIASQPL